MSRYDIPLNLHGDPSRLKTNDLIRVCKAAAQYPDIKIVIQPHNRIQLQRYSKEKQMFEHIKFTSMSNLVVDLGEANHPSKPDWKAQPTKVKKLKDTISVRIPFDLIEKVKDTSVHKNISLSQAIVDALTFAYANPQFQTTLAQQSKSNNRQLSGSQLQTIAKLAKESAK